MAFVNKNESTLFRVISKVNKISFFILLLCLECYIIFVSFFNGFNAVDIHFIIYPETLHFFFPLQLLIILSFIAYIHFIQNHRASLVVGVVINTVFLGLIIPFLLDLIRSNSPSDHTVIIKKFNDTISISFIMLSLLISIFLFIEYLIWTLQIKRDKNSSRILYSSGETSVYYNYLTWKKERLLPSRTERWSKATEDLIILQELIRIRRGSLP